MSEKRRAKRAGAVLMLGAWLALFSAAAGGCDIFKEKEKKAFAEACVQGADCESLACATYGSICTKDCTYDKDCGGDLVCRVKDTGAGSECSKPFGVAPAATSVCSNASDCQHARCVKKAGEATGVCSKTCQELVDCPAGMKICDVIPDTGSVKLCLPGDEATPAAEKPKYTAPKPTPTAKTDGGVPTDAGGTDASTGTGTDAGPKTDAGTSGGTDAGPKTDAGTSGGTDAGSDAGRVRPIIKIRPK